MSKSENPIFVFGSNLAGRHGKGAALTAARVHGAVRGVGVGRTGNAYAIPTKDSQLRSLPLSDIKSFVERFMEYARDHLELQFYVTRIGCGLAGYTESEIRPMFENPPPNCQFTWLGYEAEDNRRRAGTAD